MLIVNSVEQLSINTPVAEILENSIQGIPGASLNTVGDGYIRYSNGMASEADSVLRIPEGPNQGIMIEENWGWRDLLGTIQVLGTSYNDPAFLSYGTSSTRQFQFSSTVYNEIVISYHIPHDYVPNTPIHIHMHWSDAESIQGSGSVVWSFDIMYAKGHGQSPFQEIGIHSATQVNPEIQYQHMVAETAEITIPGLEIDGIVIVRMYRDIFNPSDTLMDPVFGHMADIHYRSNSLATKNKAPNFYI